MNCEMGGSALYAAITVILKEEKNSCSARATGLIAILNADTKLYTKVLARRLKDKISTLLHSDQVGFIPGREGRDNGVRSLLLLEAIKFSGPPGLFLSIDTEKAFNRVDRGLMLRTLEVMGIGPRMINWIKVLYRHPPASVRVNGVSSLQFTMKNGTRQGCPLSPLLFVLSLEPFLAPIRNNLNISGIRIGEEEHKLAAFADDVLFYITKPRITNPNLLEVMRKYGDISNFKINLNKSVILNVNLTKQEGLKLLREFPFPWKKDIKYLGIRLTDSLRKMYLLNFVPLLDEIKKEIKNVSACPLSWIGCINTVKMVLAPKILYKFQMLPIPLPQSYLRTLRGLISKFIWSNKKPQIAYSVLSRGKSRVA